ncbi:hypothetical protein D3C75_762840 [compost metagenome]
MKIPVVFIGRIGVNLHCGTLDIRIAGNEIGGVNPHVKDKRERIRRLLGDLESGLPHVLFEDSVRYPIKGQARKDGRDQNNEQEDHDDFGGEAFGYGHVSQHTVSPISFLP